MDTIICILVATCCITFGIIGLMYGGNRVAEELSGVPSELIVKRVVVDKDSTTYKFGGYRYFTSVDKKFNVGDTLVLCKRGKHVENAPER